MTNELQTLERAGTLPTYQQQWTEEEAATIKNLLAPDANESEFKLYLYTATLRGLNPMLKQIYCIHLGGKMTIQTSIDGYRLIANRTGKHQGTERGVLRDTAGNCTGAWAKVYREGWVVPASTEISLGEYDKKQGVWKDKKETMLMKCAEAACLRMAFPEDLSGLYTFDEMESVQLEPFTPKAPQRITEKDLQDAPMWIHVTEYMKAYKIPTKDFAAITGLETWSGQSDEVLENALNILKDYVANCPPA